MPYFVLKTLMRLMGGKTFVDISSSELSKEIGTSQQSASNYINSLVSDGYVIRKMEARRQVISITEKGLKVLYGELNDLTAVLDVERNLAIKGKVTSGLGEGRYYISRKGYYTQFNDKLGFIPYLGTLNVTVNEEYMNHYSRLSAADGIRIEGFQTEDRTFGAVKAFKGKIFTSDCAVIMPERTVHTDIIEIICSDYLRGKYDLKDGDEVFLKIDLKA